MQLPKNMSINKVCSSGIKRTQRVAVLFGGPSTEHEVSIITGVQVLNNIDGTKFDATPVYISKNGEWYTGSELTHIEAYRNLPKLTESLNHAFIPPDTGIKALMQNPKKHPSLLGRISLENIDVAFFCFHGSLGENGSAQGLLELADIPYTGSGVLASAICMDKILTKGILKTAGIPTVKDYFFLKEEWNKSKNTILKEIEGNLQYPLFVKPSNGGSSIGVNKAQSRKELVEAIETAKFYDRRILVEESLEDAKEVNISILGYKNLEASVCEQPVATANLLSYEDKYIHQGGKSAGMATAKRIIPAPIKTETKSGIEEYAKKAFRELDCAGVVRIDFLVSQDEKVIYLNEVNTIPGSLSFYLWEPKKIKFKMLITKLIELAVERHEDQQSLVRTFNSNILENFSGTKAAKN